MKRTLNESTNDTDENEPPNKRRRILANYKQNTNVNTNLNTNDCKYWKLDESETQYGYFRVVKLYVSMNMQRIGIILSRKTNTHNKFKIVIIEININNSRYKQIWCKIGAISSTNQIAFDNKLSICIIAYKCNDIDLYQIPDRFSKKNISIKNGQYSHQNIALFNILNNNEIILITKRGMLCKKYLNQYDANKELILGSVNVVNTIKCDNNVYEYIILPEKNEENEIIIYDEINNTEHHIKHDIKTLKTTNNVKSCIANKYSNRIILISNDMMYCLEINQRNILQTISNNVNTTQHVNGSVSFSLGDSSDSKRKKIAGQSNLVFKDRILSHFKISNFYNKNTFIGHNKNEFIIWRIFNTKQTITKMLLRSTMIFDELICEHIAEYLSEIPQKIVIKFVDCNNTQFNIECISVKCGFIILTNNYSNQSFIFKLDYSLILNQANKSKCLYVITAALKFTEN